MKHYTFSSTLHGLLVTLLVFSLSCNPTKKPSSGIKEGLKLLSSTESKTTYQISFDGFKFREVITPAGPFQRFRPNNFERQQLLSGDEFASTPEVPVYTTFVALPIGFELKKENIQVSTSNPLLQQGIKLYPVQEEQYTSEEDPREYGFNFNQQTYQRRRISPQNSISIIQTQERPFNIYKIAVAAVDYDPIKEELTTFSQIKISINHSTSNSCFAERLIYPNDTQQRDRVDEYLEEKKERVPGYVINGTIVGKNVCNRPVAGRILHLGAQLLIVTSEDFLPAAARLKRHKESIGIRTRVVSTAEILQDLNVTGSASDITDEQIKDWIMDFDQKTRINLRWLLLMGDAEYIPTHYISRISNNTQCAGDQFYGQYNGRTISIPQLGIGRIPADKLSEARLVVDRIMTYELNSPNADPFFHQKMSFAAQFQDKKENGGPETSPDGEAERRFAQTSEDIRGFLKTLNYSITRIYRTRNNVSPEAWKGGEAIPTNLQKPNFAWDGDTRDILNSINNGRIIMMHRDHGSKNGWGTPSFKKEDLENVRVYDNQYPLVFSINCVSGVFDNETANLYAVDGARMKVDSNKSYWAEKFLLQEDGAIGIICDTRNSATHMNNFMAKGLFDAIFPAYQSFGNNQPNYHLGDILNHAKAFVSHTSSSNSSVIKENTIYNLLGDPSLKVIPRPMYQVSIAGAKVEENILEFTLNLSEQDCGNCPKPTSLRETPIIMTLADANNGNIIARTLVSKAGKQRIPVSNFNGSVQVTLSGASILAKQLEVTL